MSKISTVNTMARLTEERKSKQDSAEQKDDNNKLQNTLSLPQLPQ